MAIEARTRFGLIETIAMLTPTAIVWTLKHEYLPQMKPFYQFCRLKYYLVDIVVVSVVVLALFLPVYEFPFLFYELKSLKLIIFTV